jgi:beta-phosphoglucomutase
VSLAGSIRGIAFDLDGVLIHSTGCHRSAFEEVLRPFGITDFDYSRYAGWRTPEVIASEFRRCGIAADEPAVRGAADRKTKLARQMLIEKNPIAEDCRPVLEGLAAKYQLALASSGSNGSVHSFLDVNGFGNLFHSVLSGEDVTHAKPDPEIYRKSFAALGLDAGSCIVVEDAVSGIEAARRAGAAAIGVVGTCSAEVLREAGAGHVVARLSELPGLLNSLCDSL